MRHQDSNGPDGSREPRDPDGAPQSPAPPSPPTPLDLNLVRTFLAVYRSGSFTAAAQLLGISQPTVTTQVRALERQSRRELFARLPRGVTPTPYAHDLATRIAGPLDALLAAAGHDPAQTLLPPLRSIWPVPPNSSASGCCPRWHRSSRTACSCGSRRA